MRQSKDRRARIIMWIISMLVVLSMGLGLAGTFIEPRIPTPTIAPTFTPFPTRTPTPTPLS